jgi:hypothetical protein
MDSRRSKRKIDNLEAEIVLDEMCYSGIVMNLSEKGLYMVTATKYSVDDIKPSKVIKMKCQLPSGDVLSMNCEVKWFRTKNSPYGITFSVGMEIIDPPVQYREFLRTLQ